MALEKLQVAGASEKLLEVFNKRYISLRHRRRRGKETRSSPSCSNCPPSWPSPPAAPPTSASPSPPRATALSFPSLRVSYDPNRPSSLLSLAIVLGSSPDSRPFPGAASAITMAVEVNTAGVVSFSGSWDSVRWLTG
ncbi:hypothetical protein E2562_023871 [Oryza meyeriana var. granulata]|uniref:Uncharacterized protein n=1 Tax=Oryza meyeriana var. granulata TaxID=110450 RepID=A0A6G1D779_9ORYZ|nr:hypothetical protein E2562_023871 [Oryza meyeriana var. granulata]